VAAAAVVPAVRAPTRTAGRRIAAHHLLIHNAGAEDGALRADMREAAGTLAGRHNWLDYSIQSLAALDVAVIGDDDDRPTTRDAASYPGEVLIRHGGYAWGWPARYCSERGDEPGLRSLDGHWVDLFAAIRRRETRQPADSLSRFAEQLLEYSSSPNEETIRKLGWKVKCATRSNWEHLRWDCQRIRAWLRASRQRTHGRGKLKV
jgi:hypothetical protein